MASNPLPKIWLRDTHAVKQCKCEAAKHHLNKNRWSDMILPYVGMPVSFLFIAFLIYAGLRGYWSKIVWYIALSIVFILSFRKYLRDSKLERMETENNYLDVCKRSNGYCCFCQKTPVLIPLESTEIEGKKEK